LKKINHIPYVTYAHGQHSQILWHNRSCWPLFVLNNAYYKGCSTSSFGKVVIFHDKSFLINLFFAMWYVCHNIAIQCSLSMNLCFVIL
jgi:hypothetical protein